MKYQPVIGLEIHAELLTQSKIFCSCPTEFGGERNTHCCPVCTAMPGALPSLNRRAVEYTIAAGLALGCKITQRAEWDRKNYFYPDLPKAYQITQLYAPLCIGGGLGVNGRFIRINHIHLEEDAGKLVHQGGKTLLDFNRAGVPLIEIVTEPDLRSPEDAALFIERVRLALVYAGVCDGKMEQGSLRCDANISLMPMGSQVYGTRTEIKNLNSFRFIKSAIEYEIKRQSEVLARGGSVIQETRRFDSALGETFSMRTKENAHDYRYFPDPDIPAVLISSEEVLRIASALPEGPEKRRERYTGEFDMSETDAETLLNIPAAAEFFDACINAGCEARSAGNLIRGEILRLLSSEGDTVIVPVSPEDMARALSMTAKGKLSANGLKEAVTYMFTEKRGLDEVLADYGLIIAEDNILLSKVIARVISENPKAVEQYKNGDQKVFGYFMGQCSRELKGKALPLSIQSALKSELEKL